MRGPAWLVRALDCWDVAVRLTSAFAKEEALSAAARFATADSSE
jgi:hypothetical protein